VEAGDKRTILVWRCELCLEEMELDPPPGKAQEEAEWVVTALGLDPVATASVPAAGRKCPTSGGLRAILLAAPNAGPGW